MRIKYEIRKIMRKMGYDISRFSPESNVLARRIKLLDSYGIDIVLDVGANEGQYAKEMRDIGFSGKIISFEPLSSAFALLKRNANGDPKWEVINCAIGDTDVKKEFNIAGNDAKASASSFLNMLPAPLKSQYWESWKYVGREIVEIKRLDSIMDSLCSADNNIYLKIDTQGFESKVIKGAEQSLRRIGTIQLEMSLIAFYEDELLLGDMLALLNDKGYSLVAIEPGWYESESGRLLQMDGIFHRF